MMKNNKTLLIILGIIFIIMISVSMINFKSLNKKQTIDKSIVFDKPTSDLKDKEYITELYICNSNNNVCEIVS